MAKAAGSNQRSASVVEFSAGEAVRAAERSGVRDRCYQAGGEGESTLERQNRAHHPAPDDVSGGAFDIIAAEFEGSAQDEAMSNVVVRTGPVESAVTDDHRRARLPARVVDALAPGVAGEERVPVREALLQLGLEAVEVREAIHIHAGDVGPGGERATIGDGAGAGLGLVDVRGIHQARAPVADVRYGCKEVDGEFPLDGKVPLLHVGILAVGVLILRLEKQAWDRSDAAIVDRHAGHGWNSVFEAIRRRGDGVDDGLSAPERRIDHESGGDAAEGVDGIVVVIDAVAGADYGFGIDLEGEADAGREVLVVGAAEGSSTRRVFGGDHNGAPG